MSKRMFGSRVPGGVGRAAAAVASALLIVVPPQAAQAVQGERGWLGVGIDCEQCDKTAAGAPMLWTATPVVTEVHPGSPAARAGLQEGDSILAIGSADLTTVEGAQRLASLRAGVPVDIWVRRNGRDLRVTVTPGHRAQVFAESASEPVASPPVAAHWDSLKVHLKSLFEEQVSLQRELRRAEQLWQATRNEEVRAWSDSQRAAWEDLRRQIDSTRLAMVRAQRRLADSLAARSLYTQRVPWQVDTVVTSPVTSRVEVRTPQSGDGPFVLMMAPDLNAVAGARFEHVNADLADVLGVEAGLLVLQVVQETPADAAGLRPGDVIVAADGEPIDSIEGLRRALRRGGAVQLVVVRKGERRTCVMSSG